MNTMKNFETAVEILYNAAPTEKARQFVSKLSAMIREKGEEWIAARMTQLHISDAEIEDQTIAPIEDNRLFYLEQWQLALRR